MKYRAILILGPTGSGKTPLGDLLEKRGLHGARCAHFDFGANLRSVAAAKRIPAPLNADDARIIRRSLEAGRLLRNNEFHVAWKVFRRFAAKKKIRAGDIVVLNGLPRHVGQAKAVERILAVKMVVSLEGKNKAMLERIRSNAGGDRAGRKDDSSGMVVKKLKIFRARTAPLLDHYRQKGVRIIEMQVEKDTTSGRMYGIIASKWESACSANAK